MRLIQAWALAISLLLPLSLSAQAPSAQRSTGDAGADAQSADSAEAQHRAALAKLYETADVRVIIPGVVFNAGLLDLAESYTKATGKTVGIRLVGMGRIVEAIKTMNPPPDVISLPFSLMGTLALDGGVVHGSFRPLGRSEMGLAVPAGKPHPDISTVEKLAAALRSAKAVMRSNPANGSMVASVIRDKVINRREFAGVNSPVSTRGEGGQALARGEGDMAIQAICEIYPYKQIELVAPLPRELEAWIDMSTAVAARAAHKENGADFIQYLLRPQSKSVWKSKGLEVYD
ncbi:MAG: substrate-binding domain-containing protein [Candidatus Korobacteraceae bacterium]